MPEVNMTGLGGFEFFVPIEKGGAKEENGKRYVYGVASDESLDLDEEIVGVGAIQKSLEYFLKHGRIDYDHKSKIEPKYIIGEPVTAKFDKHNQFHIKAEIYKGLEIADQVWAQLNAGNSRLGWSIGGRVLEKAEQFSKSLGKRVPKVTRALINHIAITPHPKNINTFATPMAYSEWVKSLGNPDNNCCGLCVLTGKDCHEMHKAISASGSAPNGVNPVVPQDLEKDVKVFKNFLTSDDLSFHAESAEKYFLKKGVSQDNAKAFAGYIGKNKSKIQNLFQRRNKKNG